MSARAGGMEPAEAALGLAKASEQALERAGLKMRRGYGDGGDQCAALFESISWSAAERKAKRAGRAEGASPIKEAPEDLARRFAQRGWEAPEIAGLARCAYGSDKKWRALALRAAEGGSELFSFMLGVCAGKALLEGDDQSALLSLAMGGDPASAAREVVSSADFGLADLALARLLAWRPEAAPEAGLESAEVCWENGVRAAVEFGGGGMSPELVASLASRLLEDGSESEDLKGWVALGEASELRGASLGPEAPKNRKRGL